jgi:DNA-binding ferritin-like protein
MNTEMTKKDILTLKLRGEDSLISEQKQKTNKSFEKMISELLTSRNQVQIFHWQVIKTGSYAAHKAYEDYYSGIVGIMDDLVESYQGKYGIIENYKCDGVSQFESIEKTITYFQELSNSVEKLRKDVKDSYLDNQIDNVIQLIQSTVYKLRFLK